MPSLSLTRVFAISALSLGVACSNAAAQDPALASAAGNGGVEPVESDLPTSLTFEAFEDGSELPARAQVMLKVRALPASKSYLVRFALPSSDGDPLDAVLDAAQGQTDADGVTTVQLTAPSAPTTFEVRASVGNVQSSLTVTVQDTGFASLQVQPAYAGFRTITTWVASAHPNKTCADLTGIPPEDGPLTTLPASSVAAPQLSQVPAGTPLAVTLRSGHFVGGCASLEKVPPGPADKPQIVEVTVLDRPIDLGASPLSVSLGSSANDATWGTFLTSAGDAVLQALRATSTDDVDTLLDAMRDADGASKQLLESARQSEGWDDLVRAHWGATADSKLHDLCAAWLAAGRKVWQDSDHLFTGSLVPIQQPDGPQEQGAADFKLLSFAGLSPATAGLVDRAQVSWSASSDDTVVLGTDLYFIESTLAEALAEAALQKDAPDAAGAVPQLIEALDCVGVGSLLAGAGTDPALAYGACGADCLTELCKSAVASIWRRGAEATGLSPARLRLTATGGARVGDAAEIAGMLGTWLGALQGTSGGGATSGLLTAVEAVAE